MKKILLLLFVLLLSACASVHKTGTLADIDISSVIHPHQDGHLSKKNESEIRAAYANYLRHAAKNDISRRSALQRLAQLEFQLTEKLEQSNGAQTDNTQNMEDKIYFATLDRSIALLKTTLKDYPHAKDNDKTLYQLAKAYDQRGFYAKSIATLKTLVKKYPNSEYYVECEFRLGEDAFSRRKYGRAEDLYTNVIVSPNNGEFLEKAIYKRGWARYKQGYYQEAIHDFLRVVNIHGFRDYAKLNSSEKSQFNEYFRAIGLAFSYLGGAQSLDTYFKKHPHFRFIYHTYAHVSDIYLKAQRYSDAADTLSNFIKYHPNSAQVPAASIKILAIWKAGGFTNKLFPALDKFYSLYHPQSRYWAKHKVSESTYNNVTSAIRDDILLAATHYHKRYMALHTDSSFTAASRWYQRYLKYYNANANKDNVYVLYAELLASHNDPVDALANYEKAAYDSGIILNKDAAYATILLADQLHGSTKDPSEKSRYLDKLIQYSLMYTRLYPHSPHSVKIITRAAQEAYQAGQYSQAVKLTELYAGKGYTTENYNINLIKANAYFKSGQYQDAEAAYQTVLQHYRLDHKTTLALDDNLAISIYDQGKQAASNGDVDAALQDYARIYKTVPDTQTASAGLYDAIVLCMNQKLWSQAIVYIKDFQTTYPNNKLSQDVSKKLSLAYLNSHQDLAAANELVKIARNDNNSDYKRAALWKAGQLYESKQDYTSAIRSFDDYARHYPRPYPQYMEAMQKLSTLYTQAGQQRHADKWRRTILRADKRTPSDLKTDRTRFISSNAALQLGHEMQTDFDAIQLTIPLARSLKRKKYYMQRAVNLYGSASSYGIAKVTTEATYAIGEIYRSFSQALLNSQRPQNLNKTELEQYNILLQDKSYPFEDKAIEFYATDLGHVKDDIYDKWMKKSYARLKQLYPERYSRNVKLEPYIDVLQ